MTSVIILDAVLSVLASAASASANPGLVMEHGAGLGFGFETFMGVIIFGAVIKIAGQSAMKRRLTLQLNWNILTIPYDSFAPGVHVTH